VAGGKVKKFGWLWSQPSQAPLLPGVVGVEPHDWAVPLGQVAVGDPEQEHIRSMR
jgi:hypothetical protein